MTKTTRFLTLLTTVCLLLSACAQAAPGTEAEPTGQTIIITPAIKGNSADLNIGDVLEVQIPTIPTDGFDWQAQNLDANILVQEGIAVYTKDTDPNSAGGMTTLRFKAVGSGKTNLSLLYVNAPSGDTPAMSMQSFGMPVEVK